MTTTTTKNLLSILFFAVSLFFLFAANNAAFSTGLTDANCYHCGSVSACVAVGQAYGWDGCIYNELENPVFIKNTQGVVTSVCHQNIAIYKLSDMHDGTKQVFGRFTVFLTDGQDLIKIQIKGLGV